MSMDLTGIGNCNEYYTNHYFSTMFEDGASERIKQWSEDAKNQNTKTPWTMLRDNAKQYYPIHDRYDRGQSHLAAAANIMSMAEQYLDSLGYGMPNSVSISIDNEIAIPVFHEVTKPNKAPLLWAVLAYSKNKDCGIMESGILDFNAVNNDDPEFTIDNIENIATKLLFHTVEPPRFLIVIGIDTIVLIDRNKWNEKRYLEFDLQEIFSRHETTTLQAMSVLLYKDSLCPSDGNALIDTLDEQSRKHASGVSQDLKYAIRESIELLGNEVIYDLRIRLGKNPIEEPVDASQLTLECLRYMYRMLFVLFIEARPELGYAPIKEQVYASGYSLESLRDIAESIRNDTEEVGEGFYLFETLNKLFELIYSGYPEDESQYNKVINLKSTHNIFAIPPLKAHIFDPQYTHMFKFAKIRNSVMLRIIDLMSLTKSTGKKGGRRGRISYVNLGINQMGAVYEALLSYRGFIAEQELYEVKKAGDPFNELDVGYFVTAQELDQYTEEERVRYEIEDNTKTAPLRVHHKGEFIYRLAGREREKSASYYTPESLTQCLVKYALKELLKDKTADEILCLTVCEPAMGSAAFLNEVINQLAEAYIDRKQTELGEMISHESRMDELQKVKMYIADNNVYGIDLNPVAVELAEVSLWLNTIYKGGYVPWFGTQLVNGNSLIGARRQVYHKSQLTTTSKGLRWYENAPERIPFVKLDASGRNIARSRNQVYHFLTGDPGMCNYTDKVIKSLEPEKLKIMKSWNKKFIAPYTEDEFKSLIELSKLVDTLWKKQIKARHDLKDATVTSLDIYGHKDERSDSGRSIREKDKFLHSIYKSEHAQNAGAYARLKFAMDYWCALWFWPISQAELLPSRAEFIFDMELILRGTMRENNSNVQIELLDTDEEDDVILQNVDLNQLCNLLPRLALVRKIASENKFMHWELEFADIFKDRGGFDLIIGNPPWVKLTWTERNILSEINPMFAIKKLSAAQTAQQREIALANNRTSSMYFNEFESITGIQNYINAFQNYPSLSGLQGNLYEGFLPQSWTFSNDKGVFAIIHPESVFTESSGTSIRKELNNRLKCHFRFSNAMKLFQDVHTSREFGLNVYSNNFTEQFEQIVNLYSAKTVDECYENVSDKPIYIRNPDGTKNTHGQKNRITIINDSVLRIFAKILDDSADWQSSRLMTLYTEELIGVLKHFYDCKYRIKDCLSGICVSMLWDETNAQKNGIIKRDVHFGDLHTTILSGAHIGTSNPLFNCSNANCNGNNDNTSIDLLNINDSYIQRCNYSPDCNDSAYLNASPKSEWNEYYINMYRIAARKMIDIEGEKTLMAALIPPKVGHTNGIIGFGFKEPQKCMIALGVFNSLPIDFFVKVCGRGNFTNTTAEMIPMFEYTELVSELVCRTALLNCLTDNYSSIWENIFDEKFNSMQWSKEDIRLTYNFSSLTGDWTRCIPIRDAYSRRQALVENDVIVAMLLGLSLTELLSIYRVQFPILQQHEKDTYYDINGSIVYAKNNALTGVGFDRNEWENNVKSAPAGQKFYRTITDNTQPGGAVERTIEYVAPFDRCDREQDYETAWKFFEQKYGGNK